MSNKNDLAKAAGTEVSFVIPNTESLGILKELNPQFSLNLKYKKKDDWAALKDKAVRAFYMGNKEIPNEDGETVVCGVFVSEKECFLSAQTTLIEAVKNLEIKTPVQITYRGDKNNKSSKGSTMIFDVEKLG